MLLSPPNPGWGWKAQSLEAPAIPSWLLAAPALLAYLAAKLPLLRQLVMRTALRAIDCEERILEANLDAWHTYEIRWHTDGVTFLVDGALTLESRISPTGPLGFVTWIDNQYAVASPEGGLRFGVISTDESQGLFLQDLTLALPKP
jgi:hypothetical protein